MMSADELMLNDKVYYSGLTVADYPCSIYAISNPYPSKDKKYDNKSRVDVFVGDGMFSATLDEIRPISLTTKILENLGFDSSQHYDENNHTYITLWKQMDNEDGTEKYDITIYYDNVNSNDGFDVQIRYNGTFRKWIHYVHELQHALRECGLFELANNININ